MKGWLVAKVGDIETDFLINRSVIIIIIFFFFLFLIGLSWEQGSAVLGRCDTDMTGTHGC